MCHERSYPLDLAPGVLIYFISHRFSILCHFLSPTPSLPLPSFFLSTKNHFHLSFHTNILTEFLLVWKKKKGGTQESKGMGQDCILHQSKLKMREEVGRKINTIRCMHLCTYQNTHRIRCATLTILLFTSARFTLSPP